MSATTELPTWNVMRPYGDHDCHESLIRTTLDGVEWVTDRYAMIRTDMLDGERNDMIQGLLGQGASNGLAEALPRLFALEPCDPSSAAPVHPLYLAALEGYDWTPVEKDQWQIRRDGQLVAMVCGMTHTKAGEAGLPGTITPAMRRSVEIIRYYVDNDRLAWEIAYKIGTTEQAAK